MTTVATLLQLIAHAQQHITALESLIAGMTTGLRACMVDPDHMHASVCTQARAINAHLDHVAAEVEKADLSLMSQVPAGAGGMELQTVGKEKEATSIWTANGWHRRK